MSIARILLLLCCLHSVSFSQWQSIGAVERTESRTNGVTLLASPGRVSVTFLASDLVRVRFTPKREFSPDSSWAIEGVPVTTTEVAVLETPEVITLTSSSLKTTIQKNPCRLTFADLRGVVLNKDDSLKGMAWSGSEVCVWKEMPVDENYFGFGEKAGRLERRGTAMTMWNSDIPAYRADTDPLYESIPFFYSIRNGVTCGVFFDNTYFTHFNMGKEHPQQYSFGAAGGELNYYFIYGPSPREVMAKFTQLIGRMPLPPRWALGYQQCRWSYYPESRVLEIAATFRSKRIPCDALYLDIHYMDGYRVFTWDPDRFPNPKKMIGDLAGDGFKTVVIIDPGIKQDSSYRVYTDGIASNHFVKYADGTPFVGKVWPGMCVFPDFTSSRTRDWWGSLFKELVDAGIRGFWTDMNEPSVFDVPTKTFDETVIHDDMGFQTDHRKNHNIYGMQMARATREGALALRPSERPFVLTRANYAGGQRFAAAWTGDNVSSWEHLAMSIPMCLNLSISGQPFVGSDIGGFIGNPTGELYARWLQLGIFTPLMRSHSVLDAKNKEPWEYGADFEDLNRTSIELRYRLLPYIYSAFRSSSESGIPMMRPVFFDFPNDRDALWSEYEFLFGDAFLVAPVINPGDTTRNLRLPEGEWVDFWTETVYPGKRWITVSAPIDRIPVFVKAGSVIPTQQVVQFSDESSIDPLTLEVYPSFHLSGTSEHYEDDGLSFEYTKGAYFLRRASTTADSTGRSVRVSLSTVSGTYRPPARSMVLKIHRVTSMPTEVRVGSQPLKALRGDERGRSARGWWYDPERSVVSLTMPDTFRDQTVSIKY